MKGQLFLDLDGVFADFEAHYLECFGAHCSEHDDDELWANIDAHGTFFLDLPMCPGAAEFLETVKHLNPAILTACPKTNTSLHATQKRQWAYKNMPGLSIFTVVGGKNKAQFVKSYRDILIDDFEKNCSAWRAAGGLAIQHDGDFERTTTKLRYLMTI
jgi:5'-nucleotidase